MAAHPIQDAPKTEHSQKPNSWRPIALLDVAYKVSAEIVHKRTRRILDAKLSLYQVGFKRGLGLEFATLVFEDVGYWNIWNGAVKFGWRVEQGDKLNPLLFNAAKFRTTFAKY